MTGDTLVKLASGQWERKRPTVVADCVDPSKAWVVDHLDHGLVMGNAYLVDLAEYAVVDRQLSL
jgi:hypothetical protein